MAIDIIRTATEMQARSESLRGRNRRIVLVPTMGYLHEGHLSLMREGRKHGDDLVVSIFVNPTQFGPGEDLATYPRSFERDRELCEKEGVAAIFAPDASEVYGESFQTYVSLEKLPNHLCGISRPVHFRGVATVVCKLFNMVLPHVAVFGRKDFQQLLVIRRMVRDLNFGIEILGAPIVREPDGLAMSSRNAYLLPEQRGSALSLSKSLRKAQELLDSGMNDARKMVDEISAFIRSHAEAEIDYVAICDPETLSQMTRIDRPALMALAVKVGNTRLIDNAMLNPPGPRR